MPFQHQLEIFTVGVYCIPLFSHNVLSYTYFINLTLESLIYMLLNK